MERKKAVVTGASRGIGKGIARCLAREGYDLAVSYATQREEAQTLSRELEEEYGGKCFFFQASLERPGAGVELLEKSVEALGGLDLLVNNAGVTRFENLLDMTPEVFDLLFNLDFKNYILMMQAAARYMVRHKVRGSLVNITSSRGERAYAGDFLYGGLKAGLNRAVQSIALPPEQVEWFQQFRSQVAVPLAMGELFNNPLEWKELVSRRLIDYIRVHISQIGGLTPARKLAALCEAFGVRTAWHGPGDLSPVGMMAQLHLDLAVPNFGIQEFSGFSPEEEEVFPGCPQVKNGYLYANDRPGFGIDLDEEKAAKYPCSYREPGWLLARTTDGTAVRP